MIDCTRYRTVQFGIVMFSRVYDSPLAGFWVCSTNVATREALARGMRKFTSVVDDFGNLVPVP